MKWEEGVRIVVLRFFWLFGGVEGEWEGTYDGGHTIFGEGGRYFVWWLWKCLNLSMGFEE